ncbi:zinc finger BED domain-containing protein RICESLEEPER 1-like isoform X3 [Magnolia sinica]|uniref:zinc finger BED domain-containing protein RICESLEEPER 1-like isoform X3 n=1 Tax=Magnolia sinica TaxID=86752 RepID=UPI00265B4BF9|nr:zinc finger BED domain-containing protein RICESLEEPER 1-like isoform X3 [Magnolia sinica]XP_058103796.1 zinc finger BED domain-containing protein RICESLEEPER 1-like isoform X3 [Magnolia sinica]
MTWPILCEGIPLKSSLEEATMRNDVDSNTAALSVERFPPKKRRLTSSVWNDFEKVKGEGGKEFATCKHCKRKLVGDSKKGTSHLHKHLKKCLLYNRVHSDRSQLMIKASEANKDGASPLMIKASEANKDGTSPLMIKTTELSKDGTGSVQNFKFDQERSRNDLARMIILHEYPFSIVNHHGFRTFLNNLQPSFKIVSRNTIKADCMKIFDVEKQKMYEVLDKLSCRISLTIDLWTSDQNLGYLSLSAHYIDDNWKLQRSILNFCLVEDLHSGEAISKVVMEKLDNWNIYGKLSSITLDNCSTNDVVVRDLVSELVPKGLLLKDGELFHVRCCTHVLNLIVHDGLEAICEVTKKVREVVKFVKSSQLRQHMFNGIARQVRAPQKKLILDVPTRWKSTYMMLETALEFKDVISLLAECDSNLKAAPSTEEWEKARLTCDCLKLFYDVSRIFSGTKYPTANRCFAEICGIHLQLKEWCVCENYFIVLMAMKMKERFDKYWSNISLILAIAAILDPRVKMKSIEYYFPKIYGNETELRTKGIRDGLHNLYNEYAVCLTSSIPDRDFSLSVENSQSRVNGGSGFSGAPSHGTFSDRRKGFDKFLQQSSSSQQVKSDLEMYLDDAAHPLKNDLDRDSLDVLGWWKFNAPKYPIVAQMARDILGIPVSTISSEETVNLGGRLLNQYRSSMQPEIVQGLICAQDWLRKELEASGLSLGESALSTLSSVTDDDDSDDIEMASLMVIEEDNKT